MLAAEGEDVAVSALVFSAEYDVSTALSWVENCDFASVLTASKSDLTVVIWVCSDVRAPDEVRLMFFRSSIEPLRVSTEPHTAGLSLPPHPTSEAPSRRDTRMSARRAFMDRPQRLGGVPSAERHLAPGPHPAVAA